MSRDSPSDRPPRNGWVSGSSPRYFCGSIRPNQVVCQKWRLRTEVRLMLEDLTVPRPLVPLDSPHPCHPLSICPQLLSYRSISPSSPRGESYRGGGEGHLSTSFDSFGPIMASPRARSDSDLLQTLFKNPLHRWPAYTPLTRLSKRTNELFTN